MDDRCVNATEPDSTSDSVVESVRDKRRRLDDLLSAQREQTAALERAIEQQIDRIRDELVSARAASEPVVDDSEHERQREALAAEAESLAKLSGELDARQEQLVGFENQLKDQERLLVERLCADQADLDQRAADLDQRAAELDVASQQLRQAQRSLSHSEEELSEDRQQVAQIRGRLEEQMRAIEQEREKLSGLRTDTNNQRRRIARELDQQRKAQKAEIAEQLEALRIKREETLAECQRRREEMLQLSVAGDAKLQSDVADLRHETEQLRGQLAEHKRLLNARSEELSAARDEQAKATEEAERLRKQCEQLSADLSINHATEQDGDGERRELEAELQSLRLKLAEADSKSNAPTVSEADTRKREDLQRRFELAVEDIRDLKRRNAQLEEQLTAGKLNASLSGDSGDKLDWESQKKRLLASLEADQDEETEEQAEDRMSVEGAIRITDEIVARKDQEIRELKRVLEEQSSNLGSVAVGASAIAEMLDQDGLVQQEREKLSKLQDEWRQKLRQAEVDISVERAKMARERAELDEKLQVLAADRARHVGKEGEGNHDSLTKSGERRWWARLGLKETDGE